MKDTDIKACPRGDNTVLPDTFPAMAHVVSDMAAYETGTAASFTEVYVEQVLKASGKRVPLILLPVSKATFEAVKRRITAATMDEELKKKWLEALVWVEDAPSWTWQQDYFEAFHDRKGNPVLRPIRGYERSGSSFDKVAAKLAAVCPQASIGEQLPPHHDPFENFDTGWMGGNIEALPGGLCLHGDNQPWNAFTKHYCGSRDNEVVVPTSWLDVGHVDEIVAVIKAPKKEAPCDFAIMIASPQKAYDLLSEDPKGKFFNFFAHEEQLDDQELADRLESDPMYHMCELALGKKLIPDFEGHPRRVRRDLRVMLLDLLVTGAIAADDPLLPKIPTALERKTPPPPTPGRRCVKGMAWLGASAAITGLIIAKIIDNARRCDKLTNEDIKKAIDNSPRFKKENDAIQEEMRRAQKTIAKKIKQRLPGCEPEFIDVPSFFYRETEYEKFNAVHPSPTNGVLVENTVLTPHPQNTTHADYLSKQYQRLGLGHKFIDTFDYAHEGRGNLHCATHSIRFCRGE